MTEKLRVFTLDSANSAIPTAESSEQTVTSTHTTFPTRISVVDEPSAYLYRLQMGAHVQTGVAACFSVDDYDRDVIKKHEKTRRDKEDE